MLQRSALELFLRDGYDATTVAAIAGAAGVSQMTFFRHFPTKESVVLDDPYDPVIAERVAKVAAERGAPRAQVALAWVLRNPVVTAPIVGASKPGHLDDAVAALDLELTDDEVAQLEEPYTPHAVAGFG